jgi:uncharacterized repeat protein (TIGR01451 family)
MHLDRLPGWIPFLLLLAPCATSQKVAELPDPSLYFEPNLGQAIPETRYIAYRPGYRIELEDSAISFVFPPAIHDALSKPGRALRLSWIIDQKQPEWQSSGKLAGRSSYFTGRDSSRWITQVPHYAELVEENAMPGVDIRYKAAANGSLEYDLQVAAGRSSENITMIVEGADRMRLCDGGALCISMGDKELRQLPPRAYELHNGSRHELAVMYELKGTHEVSFAVPNRTSGAPLLIDPVVQYATYLGGSDKGIGEVDPSSNALGIAVDRLGNFFVAGHTTVLDFPETAGAFQTTCPGGQSGCAGRLAYFVSKFSPSGQLLYSTYLTGIYGTDYWGAGGKVLAVDDAGIAYLVGAAFQDFPTTSNAFQKECAFEVDMPCAIVTKISADGSQLLYSTYFGEDFQSGNRNWTMASGMALGPHGDVYIAGWTAGSMLPTTVGAFQTTCPKDPDGYCQSGFVARFRTEANGPASLGFATYLGAVNGYSEANGVALDKYGDVYVVGLTTADLPHIAIFGTGISPVIGRGPIRIGGETFVAKLSGRDGHALRGSTLLRGVSGTAIAVDTNLNTYVVGAANGGMAVTPGVVQNRFGGGTSDAFVAKLGDSGYSLLYSTFIGGSGNDSVRDISLDNRSQAFITGTTSSTNFPVSSSAFKKIGPASGGNLAFVAALTPGAAHLYYSSYLGGSSSTTGRGIALDNAWNAYVVGATGDSDFKVTADAFQPKLKGVSDAFVAKVVITGDLRASMTTSTSATPTGGIVIYHARITNLGPDGSDNIVFTDNIPAGMFYAGVYVPNGDGCTEPPYRAVIGTLTCRKRHLEPGDTLYVNVYLRAVRPSGTSVTNRVNVTAQTQDIRRANNTVSAIVYIH